MTNADTAAIVFNEVGDAFVKIDVPFLIPAHHFLLGFDGIDGAHLCADLAVDAKIVRTEGMLDQNSLELFAIAVVQDPFGLHPRQDQRLPDRRGRRTSRRGRVDGSRISVWEPAGKRLWSRQS